MLGLYLIFFFVGLLGKALSSWISPNVVVLALFLSWILHLFGLAHRTVARKYRYVVPWLGMLLLLFAGLSAVDSVYPSLGLWGQIFISGAIVGHALLILSSDTVLRKGSASAYIWLLVHNLAFVFLGAWFLIFNRLLWPVVWALLCVGLVSLYMALRTWDRRSTTTVRVVDASALLILSALYMLVIAGIVKLVYVLRLDVRVFWSTLIALGLVSLGLILFFGEGVKRWMKALFHGILGYQQYDPVKEWDDFLSTIEDITDEDEIVRRAREYFGNRFGVGDLSIVWKGESELFDSLPPEVKKYLWLKDGPVSPEEIWRMGLEEERFKDVELIIPLVFRKQLVGLMLLKGLDKGTVPSDLIYMIGRNISVMLTLSKLSRQLMEIQQFAQFNRVVSFLVHDVKNSVSGLSLLVMNWEKNKDNPEFVSDAYITIKDVLARLKAVVDKLSSYRKSSSAEVDTGRFSPREVVEEVLERLNLGATGIRVEVEIDKGLALNCSRSAFARIVENLLLNAVDAIRKKGEGEITIWSERNDRGEWSIIVKDTGIGMDEEFVKKKLFRPFVSTKESGLGIGMYEVKSLLETCNGRIEVVSERNVGTEVILRFGKEVRWG